MSITCGFFNSQNGDRKYSAADFGRVFDGIIGEGILKSIGKCFEVSQNDTMGIKIGSGKAWYLNSWLENDTDYPMDIPDPEVALDRIDAVVMEFDSITSIRANTFKIIKGTPADNPKRPTLVQTRTQKQVPLAYVTVKHGATKIYNSGINRMVGRTECPYVDGLLDVANITGLLAQWQGQIDKFKFTTESDIDRWFLEAKEHMSELSDDLSDWTESQMDEFLSWFTSVKTVLSEDAAGAILNKIDRERIDRVLSVGFVDGKREYFSDGKTIVSTALDGSTLTKTFSDDNLTMTAVLMSPSGGEVARMVKHFDVKGQLITSDVTYV